MFQPRDFFERPGPVDIPAVEAKQALL
jgi:hypothetical protein